MARYVLRELPGIAAIEARLRSRDENWESGASWRPEYDTLDADIRAASIALFGVTEDGTRFEWDHAHPIEGHDAAYRAWELNFELLYCDFDQSKLVWEALGWDVSDGDDDEAYSLSHLGRQIIGATKGMFGHLPDSEDALDAQAARLAETWAAGLQQRPNRR